jgi:ribosome-binding protein aMBF1 (putative translation factor)
VGGELRKNPGAVANQIKETRSMSGEPLPRTLLEPVCEALAHVIRKHRKARKLSMNGLAKRTRLSRQMIAMVESRRRVNSTAAYSAAGERG